MPVLHPLTDAEYARWVNETIPAYAGEKVASDAWTAEESLARSRAELESLLPDGLSTPDHVLCSVLDEYGTRVGMLWYAIKDRANDRIAYVYNIEVDPKHRRKGHARRAMEALEQEVRRQGLAGIALHVFGHNVSAQALYATLGYVPTNISLFKRIDTRHA